MTITAGQTGPATSAPTRLTEEMRDAMAMCLGAIARIAGGVILETARKGLREREKADGSLCTAADVAAEEVIAAALAEAWPDIPVVGEEGTAAACEHGGTLPPPPARFFLVDPLDGTSDFIAGTGAYTVNIALIEDRGPTVGAIYAPVQQRLWIGGARAFRADASPDAAPLAAPLVPISARSAPDRGLSALASLRHGDAATESFLAALPIAGRTSASSSLKFCVIAEGGADVYPRFGRTMEWDTAAGDAILRAAGGAVLDPQGAPLRYGKAEAGFANGAFVAWGDPVAARRLASAPAQD